MEEFGWPPEGNRGLESYRGRPRADDAQTDPRHQVLACLGGRDYADRDLAYRETYYQVWPDGRARRAWPSISYWRMTPKWVRYTDYDRGPLIVESKVT
jgi:hypothetical protein